MNFDRLTEFLDTIPAIGAPGVDCIVKKDGATIYRHFAGDADREKKIPMNGKELFYLYSASKVITCTAALQLYEKGSFLLTDPLGDYIPEFRHMKVKVKGSDGTTRLKEAENPITIGDLFTMSAGLGYDLASEPIKEVLCEKGDAATTQDIVRAMAKVPLHYEPGTQWEYSLAHDVLGALIEVVSGESFGGYLKKHIFEPLGMEHTGFCHDETVLSQMMMQYRRDDITGEIRPIGPVNGYILSPKYESGGAGLVSSVEDYAKFSYALANGGVGENGARILAPVTVELMRTDRLNARQKEDFNWIQMKGYGYGLGVRTLVDKAASGSLGPIGEFGWGGAAGVYVIIDPVNRLSLFYAQHMLNSMEPYVHPRIRNILYTCLE